MANPELGMKSEPDWNIKYGFGVMRRTLIEAIAYYVESTKVSVLISREDALKIAMETSRVVGEFLNWVEHLQRIQLETLNIYSPYSARIFREQENVKPNQSK